MVFNGAVPTDPHDGIEWTARQLEMSGGQLLSNASDGVVDHDIFVFASSQTLTKAASITVHVHDRIRSGALLLCFVETVDLSWLPGNSQTAQVQTRNHGGREVVVMGRPLFEGLSNLVAADSAFSLELIPFGPPVMWDALVVAKDGRAVTAIYHHGSGHVLLLPPMAKTRGKVMGYILDTLLPQLQPNLHSRRKSSTREQAPGWAAAVLVPGADAISARISSVHKQLAQLQEALSEEQARLDALLGYRDILWLGGYDLEDAVRRALTLLGIEAAKREPVDLVHDLRDGRRLFIEIEGTEGHINLRKGQQLGSYIMAEDNPAAILGAIIGNPWRTSPLDQRPPAGARLFVRELEALATKQGWRLVQTSQLFDLVCRYLGGDETQKERAREDARRLLGIEPTLRQTAPGKSEKESD